MVVISIIGILMGIIIPSLGNARSNSRDSKRISDIKTIQLNLGQYYNDNGHYPCSLTKTSTINGCAPDFTPTYMQTIPTDPLGNAYYYTSYNYGGQTTNCTSNNAANPPVISGYHLGAQMENSESGATGPNVGAWQDADWTPSGSACAANAGGQTANFNGMATNCTPGAAANTSCKPI
jgi:type II secretory pathway pseudopilin PulG